MENTSEKKKAGRPRLSRATELERLKALVFGLREQFGPGPYTRTQIETVAGKNIVGLTLFTSSKKGFGLETRLNHGLYRVPDKWSDEAPWSV